MLTPPHVIALTMMRQTELIREAEIERLVREAAAHEDNTPIYHVALAAFGRRLSLWGDQLQERYDHPFEFQLEGGNCEQS